MLQPHGTELTGSSSDQAGKPAPGRVAPPEPGQAGASDPVTELRRALDEDELRLHYQPVADPATGEILGAEALLRWQHPERGLLGPADFLDAADRSELTAELAEWVAASAVAECAHWPETWFVSINLSPRQLVLGSARGLRDTLAELCRHHAVSPSRLWVELTEQGPADDRELASLLGALASLGVQVALDDFGSGSASLGRLRRLPFAVTKLDRSLLPATGDTAPVLRLALDLAHACGTRVVAEGVETPEQLALLRELGCDLVQGFHLARPMPPADLRALAGSVLTPAGGEHRLALHDGEPDLERLTIDFAAPALRGDASVVLIAPGARLRTLADALDEEGLDLETLRSGRRLLELDADLLLDTLLIDGRPTEHTLRALVTEILRWVASGTGPVRMHAAMAAMLWERGQRDAALRLEELWHQLEGVEPFVLLCPYPASAFAGPDGARGVRALRERHDRTLPGDADRARAVSPGTRGTAPLADELRLVHRERVPADRGEHHRPPPAPGPAPRPTVAHDLAPAPRSDGPSGRRTPAGRRRRTVTGSAGPGVPAHHGPDAGR